MKSDHESSQVSVQYACEILRKGGIVAYPTETFYGLAVDPFNRDALNRLFYIKKRPLTKPISVLIGDHDQLDLFTPEIPSLFEKIIKNYWPGPLTLVFPARNTISLLLTGGSGTVGIRLSPHPLAGSLLAAYGGPLTATSANRSGDVPAITALEVSHQFHADVDFVLDGGPANGGMGSTLVGINQGKLQLIRNGVVDFKKIEVLTSR